MLKSVIVVAAVAVFASGPSVVLAAQNAPSQSPAPPFTYNPTAPNSGQSAQVGHNDAKQTANQSLTDKLARSNGTIAPPQVDTGMTKSPPRTGTMPILKPPPNVQSK
jgi:hypothetical protein